MKRINNLTLKQESILLSHNIMNTNNNLSNNSNNSNNNSVYTNHHNSNNDKPVIAKSESPTGRVSVSKDINLPINEIALINRNVNTWKNHNWDLESVIADITSNKRISDFDLYKLLIHFEHQTAIIDNSVLINCFIKHFSTFVSLATNDAQENNLFHWIIKLKSIDAWRAINEIIDDPQNNALLTQTNHFGETPLTLLYHCQDTEFVGNVLLFEAGHPKGSEVIQYFRTEFNERSYEHKSDLKFIFHIMQDHAVYYGNTKELKESVKEYYIRWKRAGLKGEITPTAFKQSDHYKLALEHYHEATLTELNSFTGGCELKIHVNEILRNPEYRVANKMLSHFLDYIKNEYQAWQRYQQNRLEKEKYSFEALMQQQRFLQLLEDILSEPDLDRIDCINKICPSFSIKDLLGKVGKETHKSLVLTIFSNEAAFTILRCILHYTEQEIIALINEYYYEIVNNCSDVVYY